MNFDKRNRQIGEWSEGIFYRNQHQFYIQSHNICLKDIIMCLTNIVSNANYVLM